MWLNHSCGSLFSSGEASSRILQRQAGVGCSVRGLLQKTLQTALHVRKGWPMISSLYVSQHLTLAYLTLELHILSAVAR